MKPFYRCPRCSHWSLFKQYYCERCCFRCDGDGIDCNRWVRDVGKHWYQFYTEDDEMIVVVDVSNNTTTIVSTIFNPPNSDHKDVFPNTVLQPNASDEDVYKLLVIL